MTQQPRMTIDHQVIKKWVEERGGAPAGVENSKMAVQEAGVLRIRFPGQPSEDMEVISWDQFFTKFDQAHLAFMYEECTESGSLSTFFKFISRNGE
ncbi:MAG: hypothetical protein LBI42_13705 [Chitinispirillales bacterium]|nr:hypothetical protein [Chitinispirillales bacterium]